LKERCDRKALSRKIRTAEDSTSEEIVKDVVAIAKCVEESVSVAIEEIQQEDWAEKVYKPGYS